MSEDKQIRGFTVENNYASKIPEKDYWAANFCKCRIYQHGDKYKVFCNVINGNDVLTKITPIDTLEEAVNFIRAYALTEFFNDEYY